MSFAALSTVIAVFENILSFYMDMAGWERKKAVGFNIVLISLLSLPAVLGFNVLSGIQPLGQGSTIMDVEDFQVFYNLLPLIIVIVYLKGYYDMFRAQELSILIGWMVFAVALLALIFWVTLRKTKEEVR